MRILLYTILITLVYSSAQSQVISTLAGTGVQGFNGDGYPALMAEFNCPENIMVDHSGKVYIADFWNGRIRMITPDGLITTIAGNGTDTHSGDGGQATLAGINSPVDIAMDKIGNLYIAEDSLTDPSTTHYTYSGSYIRKVDTNGVITTIAGNGSVGTSGDSGLALNAGFYAISGICLDDSSNIYVTDYEGVVRKINRSGIITTVAGMANTYGFSGDNGPATSALFRAPSDVVVDHHGNIYIADDANNRIRRVDTAGIITTIAGCDTNGAYGGNGGPATAAYLYWPEGITVDDTGNLYFAEFANAVIRKVDTAGIISTVAGNNINGYSGDGGLADTAELWDPTGIAIDSLGNMYISDFGNEDVRVVTITNAASVKNKILSNISLNTWPEPNNGTFTLRASSAKNEIADISVTDINGRTIKKIAGHTNKDIEININAAPGVYFLTVSTENELQTTKMELR